VRQAIEKTTILLVALLIALAGFTLSCAKYNECRTEHPWWYCLDR
jgi:hypothetical protein